MRAKQEPVKASLVEQSDNKMHELTGNSFFNDVTLNMKKDEKIKPSLGSQGNMIKKSAPKKMAEISEEPVSEGKSQGFNVYQMEQAKPNPEAQTLPPSDPVSGTKIKRENVNKDLNCTINDESILEYIVDENGYLMTGKGQLMYDDDGKVVKLTEEQIKKFQDNEMYEEVEC